MDNLTNIFNYNGNNVRTIIKDNKIWFCGKDIASILGYVIPSKAINTHCKGVSKMEIPTNGGKQKMLFISEGDIYRLIINSQLPEAEKFEKWIFDEVIPSIRKHGMYATENTIENMIANPDFAIQLLQELKKEKEEKKLIEQQRDEAIRTKAMISDKKTATALGQVGGLTAENNKLKKQLKIIKGYATILAIQQKTGNTYPYGPLKRYCEKNNLTIEKVPDARYKEVNSYPKEAWKAVYNIDI